MSSFFHLILTQPLFNALVFLYENITFQDFGFAIIGLTLLIRLILYPVFYKGLKNQTIMQKMQPEIKEAQNKHKGNREAQALALMEIYKKYNVSPFAPFLYLMIQLPILIAVYRVFLKGFTTETMTQLYSFIPAPEQIHTLFLGLIDITKTSIIIVILAVVAQYIQTRMSLKPRAAGPKNDPSSKMAGYMVYIAPLITLLFLMNLPSAIGLYWLTTAIFSIFQQQLINKRLANEDLGRIVNPEK